MALDGRNEVFQSLSLTPFENALKKIVLNCKIETRVASITN